MGHRAAPNLGCLAGWPSRRFRAGVLMLKFQPILPEHCCCYASLRLGLRLRESVTK
jgi:hypothetical protein